MMCGVLCRAGAVVSMAWVESQQGPDPAADAFSNRAAWLLPPLLKPSKAAGAAVPVSMISAPLVWRQCPCSLDGLLQITIISD